MKKRHKNPGSLGCSIEPKAEAKAENGVVWSCLHCTCELFSYRVLCRWCIDKA